jgi:hypothetical protein
VILSDRSIREELAAGRIVIDLLGDDASAVLGRPPLRLVVRAFRNDTTPYIDRSCRRASPSSSR